MLFKDSSSYHHIWVPYLAILRRERLRLRDALLLDPAPLWIERPAPRWIEQLRLLVTLCEGLGLSVSAPLCALCGGGGIDFK